MTCQCIGRSPNLVIVELEPQAFAGGSDIRIQRLRALPTAKLQCPVGFAIHAFLWHVGIELEWPPDYVRTESISEMLQPIMQPVLADVTPRADQIGVDFDAYGSYEHFFRSVKPYERLLRSPFTLAMKSNLRFPPALRVCGQARQALKRSQGHQERVEGFGRVQPARRQVRR